MQRWNVFSKQLHPTHAGTIQYNHSYVRMTAVTSAYHRQKPRTHTETTQGYIHLHRQQFRTHVGAMTTIDLPPRIAGTTSANMQKLHYLYMDHRIQRATSLHTCGQRRDSVSLIQLYLYPIISPIWKCVLSHLYFI